MDTEAPTAAVYAGSLARTYEYRTTGVPTPPHIHWSFSVKPGARITCPILVAQNRVYVADSAGYVTALDAHSGDLVWSFPTDWVKYSKEQVRADREGVTAFCLEGALGYVASARDTLYELDLSTGQTLPSGQAHFEEEEDAQNFLDIEDIERMEALFIHRGDLFLLGSSPWSGSGIYRLDRGTGEISGEIPLDQYRCDYPPTVYCDLRGQPDLIFGFFTLNNYTSTIFEACELSEMYPDGYRELWTNGGYPPPENDPLCRTQSTERYEYGTGGEIVRSNIAVMDGVLYAVADFCQSQWVRGREVQYPRRQQEFTALLALDPQSGAVKWRCDIPLRSTPIQLVAASHQVFVVMKDRVRSIDAQTHQPRWTWKAAFPVRHALAADGLLYVLGTQGKMVALEASTGEMRWTWQVQGEILKDWSTIDNGTLFIATTNVLYALRSG